MKTDTSDVKIPSNKRTLSANTVFELLQAQRRRYALHYLSQKVGAVPITELAEQIALWEGDPTYDRVERICTGLHHRHLPKLVDTQIVRYDPTAETVELQPLPANLESHLELAVLDDL
ncbi:hypothetical protein OB955_18490 [Halobacteria archaeon AArc-m2/3/4]|uniref:DUF7344 domain-containing protein n=1 Tax=Natronoglomus mannanivorans TaxID=2979990 RepID=A0AAP2Z0F3_9EURY|nr:hypothetical protein [Halobacteria archaeon AArc-xg1-1]MCU4974711.1 hypothetical protein [Halobacteria archaeon AArc-m2/3/4]